MPTVCVSCGLTADEQGRLTIDRGPWPFSCPPGGSNAEPVGCASDGRLWAPPRQIVVTDFYSADTPGLTWIPTPTPIDPADPRRRTFTLQITNPDPCRRLRGIAILEIDPWLDMGSHSEVTAYSQGDQAVRWRNDFTSTRRLHQEFTDTLEVNAPPGGAQTLTWTVTLAAEQGTVEPVRVECTVRIMAVSSDPT